MRERRLIVNADDFGLTRGITDGIILAHRYGFLTSTSLMANMPAAKYAVDRLLSAPRLGIGIHLNICTGRPILPPHEIPSLVDGEGHFHAPHIMIRKLWTWRASSREIEAEFRAQIRWMRDRGVVPEHADSHHHMHLYPAAVMPFIRALNSEELLCARAPRSSVWPKGKSVGGPHEGSVGRRLSVHSYRSALQLIAFRNLRMPESRISFLSRDRHNLAALGECWKAALANLPPGTFELACHPGLFERGFSETDRIRTLREEELYWLTNREWRDVIEGSGVQLITYRDLFKTHGRQPVAHEAAAL
ncbi:MAG TPA: ChbG/HpnK family deacetylase [Candidatus Acidoferrales bacterium]